MLDLDFVARAIDNVDVAFVSGKRTGRRAMASNNATKSPLMPVSRWSENAVPQTCESIWPSHPISGEIGGLCRHGSFVL